ncbi:MAG: hypothetical protein ABI970_02750 [Chloroflexota bacterium]
MDNLSLPAGWITEPSDKADVRYYFWKEFHDGMVADVYVIDFRGQYRVTTQAWQGTTDSQKSVVATVSTLGEALTIAYKECRAWDDQGAKIEQHHKTTRKPY